MNLKFYTSEAKELKLKARKFWGQIPTFVEVTWKKLVGGLFAPPPPSWIVLKCFIEKLILGTLGHITVGKQIFYNFSVISGFKLLIWIIYDPT